MLLMNSVKSAINDNSVSSVVELKAAFIGNAESAFVHLSLSIAFVLRTSWSRLEWRIHLSS
jgi:hypothetical protein